MKLGIKSEILLKRFDNEPISNGKYLKTRKKFYEGIITNAHNSKMPNKGYHGIFLSVILIDSLFMFSKWEKLLFSSIFRRM